MDLGTGTSTPVPGSGSADHRLWGRAAGFCACGRHQLAQYSFIAVSSNVKISISDDICSTYLLIYAQPWRSHRNAGRWRIFLKTQHAAFCFNALPNAVHYSPIRTSSTTSDSRHWHQRNTGVSTTDYGLFTRELLQRWQDMVYSWRSIAALHVDDNALTDGFTRTGITA